MKSNTFIQLLILFLLIISSAQADDIPKSLFGKYDNKVPKCYHHQGKDVCDGYHWDSIEVTPKSSSAAYVSIRTIIINDHGCVFEGIGRWDGEKLNVEGRKLDGFAEPGYIPKEACKLSIRIDVDTAAYIVEE